MHRLDSLLLSLMLLPACVEDLELDTDGGDGSEASGNPEENPSADDTGTPAPPVIEDPEAWAMQMATQRCAAFDRCGCFAEGWSWFDPDQCLEGNLTFYRQRAQWAASAGAVLEAGCYASHVSALFEGACEDTVPPVSSLSVGEVAFCKLFVGEAGLDEPCTSRLDPFANDDTCVADLMCVGGRCVAEPGDGEACGEDDTGVTRCAFPLLCLDGVCLPRLGVGESCAPFTCDVGLVCEDGTCEVAGAPGADCDQPTDCVSQRCVDSRCEAPAAALCGPYAYEVDIPPG